MDFKKKIILSLLPLLIILSTLIIYNYRANDPDASQGYSSQKAENKTKNVFTHDFAKQEKSKKSHEENGKSPQLLAKETYIKTMKKVVDQFELIDSTQMKPDEYGKLLSEGLKTFPEKSLLRKLSSQEVHNFPEPVSLAGEFMGILKKHLKENSELMKPAQDFYGDCIHKEELATSIRALCLVNLKEIALNTGRALDTTKFDPKIVELAKFLDLQK